jgi:DNA-binding CsgD family transcriptional regulator
MNAQLELLFDNEFFLANRRSIIRDPEADFSYRRFVDRLGWTHEAETLAAEPIVIKRSKKAPLILRILPVNCSARSPFLGGRAILVFSDMEKKTKVQPTLLARAFGLSPAEARLASLFATGISPERAADELGLSQSTVRNQLKAIFAKTKTHRQAELVALLRQL